MSTNVKLIRYHLTFVSMSSFMIGRDRDFDVKKGGMARLTGEKVVGLRGYENPIEDPPKTLKMQTICRQACSE